MTSRALVDIRELAWAAGLFEGEGCIHLSKRRYPKLALTMSDEDSVKRFHAAIGGLGNVGRPYVPGGNPKHKTVWPWHANKFEHVQAIIAMLWYGLGERRRDRCVEVLTGVDHLRPKSRKCEPDCTCGLHNERPSQKCEPGCTCGRHTSIPYVLRKRIPRKKCEPGCVCSRHTPSVKCRNGHLRTEETTIYRPDGRVECRVCNRIAKRDSYRRINKVPQERFRVRKAQ